MKLLRSIDWIWVGLYLICIAAGLALFSCSPQQRLNHLVKHHPELLQNDTITVPDSIPYTKLKSDTSFFPLYVSVKPANLEEAKALIKELKEIYGDSLVTESHGIKTSVVFNDDGTIGVKSKTVPPRLPLIKKIRVPVEHIHVVEKQTTWEDRFVWILVGALIGAVVVFALFFGSQKKSS